MNYWSVLSLIFIVLKLCDVIAWSWIWVLSPIWIGILFNLLILGVLAWIKGK